MSRLEIDNYIHTGPRRKSRDTTIAEVKAEMAKMKSEQSRVVGAQNKLRWSHEYNELMHKLHSLESGRDSLPELLERLRGGIRESTGDRP